MGFKSSLAICPGLADCRGLYGLSCVTLAKST